MPLTWFKSLKFGGESSERVDFDEKMQLRTVWSFSAKFLLNLAITYLLKKNANPPKIALFDEVYTNFKV
jgi:hypothetical protein